MTGKHSHQKMGLSIVVPTIDSVEKLPRLVKSLIGQLDEAVHELIFLDSESTDGTIEYIGSIPFRNVTIYPVRRCEFSHSRTRMFGAEVARGRMIVFLSDDVLPVGEHFLAELCAPVAKGLAAASFGVSQISPETGDPLRAYRYNGWYASHPEVVPPISMNRWNELSPRERYRLCRFDDCASCYDRDVLLAVRFPDVPYGEDIAVAKMLLLSGHPIGLAKQARFYHWHNVSYRYLLKRMCIDQILIRELFDLAFMNNLPKLLSVMVLQLFMYTALGLILPGIDIRKRVYWILYSIKFIAADNIGKYIGCLSQQEVASWNILDRYLLRKKQAFHDEVLQRSIKQD